jgi:hypothetical protein
VSTHSGAFVRNAFLRKPDDHRPTHSENRIDGSETMNSACKLDAVAWASFIRQCRSACGGLWP